MPLPHDRVVAALEQTLEAIEGAEQALHVAGKEVRQALSRAAEGVPPTSASALRESPVSRVRNPLDEALTQLEKTRHNVILTTFATALDDGMSMAELGRIYGFSRQRASRLAQEARELDSRYVERSHQRAAAHSPATLGASEE